jgi:hypothetical protein
MPAEPSSSARSEKPGRPLSTSKTGRAEKNAAILLPEKPILRAVQERKG